MTARNDVTGDAIATKAASQAYRDNYDAIFRKKEEKPEDDKPQVEPPPAKPETQE